MSLDPEAGLSEADQAVNHAEERKKKHPDVDLAAKPPSASSSSRDGLTLLSRLRGFEARMDRKLGMESEAITRKRAEDKKPVPWHEELSMALLWASGIMNVSCFATGFLGPATFGLSLRQSILVTVFASLLGAALTGACATFGAATGLRQISVSRYSFGWWPNKLVALLNCIQQVGWAAVSCITGGLALTAVSDGRVSLALGIVVLAVVALAISLVGLGAILVYERYAWVVFFVIFLIIFGETGRFAVDADPTATGSTLTGGVLSLLAIVYGSSASWNTIASDYYVHYPADVSRVKVFLLTTFGIAIPTSLGMVAGCVVASALPSQPTWSAAYSHGLGYLIQTALHPRGFAKFLLALLVLSGINNVVLNIYSAAISFQQLSRPCARIPRFVWTFLVFACIVALALGGRAHLNDLLQSFLSLLGYWCTSYGVIVLEEHYLFRGGSLERYDLDGWNDPARLPRGYGASVAFGLGVVSWCMGMDETWFVGPLAKRIGTFGGDVANEFTFVVTALAYVPARYLEIKYCGR